MKRIFILTVLLLAGCSSFTPFQNEAVWQGLNAVDYAETVSRPGCISEANPMLGSNPTNQEVLTFAVAGSALHYLVTRFVRESSPEHELLWQRVSIGVKFAVVGWNGYLISKGCN